MVSLTLSDRLKYLVLIFTSLSGITALVGLVGLHINVWGFATLGMGFVPIAPSAVYSFILLALSVFIYTLRPNNLYARWFAGVVTTLVFIADAFLLLQHIFGFDLHLEYILIPAGQRARYVDLRMAPISAFTFVLNEIAILMLVIQRESLLVRNIAASLILVTITIAVVVIIGYGYGSPLLYGVNPMLPMALLAAIAFLFLGIGLLASVGTDNWVVQQFVGKSVRALLLRTFLPLTLAILIAQGWMGFYFVSHFRTNPALATALFAVFTLFLVGVIVASLASRIGGQIDQKEAERREAESVMRESEEKFRTLFESADDAILLMDYDCFLDCNGSALTIFGCSEKDQIIGQTIHAFNPPQQPDGRESKEETLCLIDAALSGTPQTFEWQHIRCDDTPFDAENSLHSIELHGKTMLQVIIRDITERKRAEEEKRAFYRETILNATDGKLRISDEIDVEPYIDAAQIKTVLNSPSEVGLIRQTTVRFLEEHGFSGDWLNDFIIAVSEAMANVVKHAGYGHVYVGADDRSVWVAVSDNGPGIESLILPRAVLLRGFSTKPSMGLGYSIMLQMASRILLKTDKNGTDVVLVKYIKEENVITLDNIPDTWDGIASE
ncbi:PAS domain S-box protein [bacterium]|nr:PAS domain S-box protein [bacterium]